MRELKVFGTAQTSNTLKAYSSFNFVEYPRGVALIKTNNGKFYDKMEQYADAKGWQAATLIASYATTNEDFQIEDEADLNKEFVNRNRNVNNKQVVRALNDVECCEAEYAFTVNDEDFDAGLFNGQKFFKDIALDALVEILKGKLVRFNTHLILML